MLGGPGSLWGERWPGLLRRKWGNWQAACPGHDRQLTVGISGRRGGNLIQAPEYYSWRGGGGAEFESVILCTMESTFDMRFVVICKEYAYICVESV